MDYHSLQVGVVSIYVFQFLFIHADLTNCVLWNMMHMLLGDLLLWYLNGRMHTPRLSNQSLGLQGPWWTTIYLNMFAIGGNLVMFLVNSLKKGFYFIQMLSNFYLHILHYQYIHGIFCNSFYKIYKLLDYLETTNQLKWVEALEGWKLFFI